MPPAIDVVEPVTPDAPLPDTMLAEEIAIPASDAVDAPNAADEIVEPIRTDLQPSAATQQEESWYAFWSPFRTELAANGFVQRLQQRTGLDYRVVRMDSGTYEVAFAYLDQTDVDQKLLAISAATGLELAVDPLE